MQKKNIFVTVLFICLMALTPKLFSSPSGLNNIPTADVVPEKVLVVQGWGNFSQGESPVYYVGAKYGPLKGVEIGIDGMVGSDDTGPGTFQIKSQLPFFGEESTFMPLVGVANISMDTDKAGKVNPYLVLTSDFDFLRVHLGYFFQEDNDGAFGGIDKTIQLFGNDFVFRADVLAINDNDDVLGSVGFLYVLPWNFVLESWVSFSSQDDQDETLTVKLNYVISF